MRWGEQWYGVDCTSHKPHPIPLRMEDCGAGLCRPSPLSHRVKVIGEWGLMPSTSGPREEPGISSSGQAMQMLAVWSGVRRVGARDRAQ